jgi:hypothetical protein
LRDEEWYEPLSPRALYESEYEQIVFDHAALIFPEFHCVYFKCQVESEYDAAKADLALIHRKYIEWWVVEVELGCHSFTHVQRQVRTLSEAVYGEDVAEYLCSSAPDLDCSRIKGLMKGQQPRVVVIVNQEKPDWSGRLERFDALVTVLEIFRSDRNSYIFRLSGEQPQCPSQRLSDCRFDPLLPRFLRVESPGALRFGPGERVCLYFEDSVTDWERVDGEDQVWLTPLGANPLNAKATYILRERDDGSLEISEK